MIRGLVSLRRGARGAAAPARIVDELQLFDLPSLRRVVGLLPTGEVRVIAGAGATEGYEWGDRTLRFVRCATCGCVTHWEPLPGKTGDRMGINARNFEPAVLDTVRIRRLDGASSWTYLD